MFLLTDLSDYWPHKDVAIAQGMRMINLLRQPKQSPTTYPSPFCVVPLSSLSNSPVFTKLIEEAISEAFAKSYKITLSELVKQDEQDATWKVHCWVWKELEAFRQNCWICRGGGNAITLTSVVFTGRFLSK